MIKEKMWVERPDETHLSQSGKTPGGRSSLARRDDTNELDTHATLYPLAEDEEARRILVLIGVAVAGVIAGAVGSTAARYFKNWRTKRSKRNRPAGTSEADSQAATSEVATLSNIAPEELPKATNDWAPRRAS